MVGAAIVGWGNGKNCVFRSGSRLPHGIHLSGRTAPAHNIYHMHTLSWT